VDNPYTARIHLRFAKFCPTKWGQLLELCRKYGISDATYYNWKAKFGGLTVSDAQRLKALETENAKLKRLLAESMLDNAALKDVVSRKW